jgi:hypothetical protein
LFVHSSTSAVDVRTVIDADDLNLVFGVVQFINDSIRTLSGRPETGQLAPEGMTDPPRVFDERPEHELHGGGGDLLR